ncbi:MAG: hypothetical protein EA424_12835 [Planctomycetaceae bacterium]|nr:MAG: hypothetical protein EA424_12835 [Planctomycetaceae bacterium]
MFTLLPGEKPLDELKIQHRRLFIVKSGTTRVTLTTHRLLYTTTRVFSPAYWLLLLVAFYPLPLLLLFYYFFRLSRNRNVALPLGNIDSFEKRYRPNWLWFALAILVGSMISVTSAGLVEGVLGRTESLESLGAAIVSQGIVQWFIWALLGAGTLVLLLATRIVGYDVHSNGNNSVPIRYSPGDLGISEGHFDAFFQNVHVQMERNKVLQPPAGPGN